MEHAHSFIAGRHYLPGELPLSPVYNPANDQVIGQVEIIDTAGLDAALQAAADGFQKWKNTSAYERGRILQEAARLIRARKEDIGAIITLEQDKPLAEAIGAGATGANNTERMKQEGTQQS